MVREMREWARSADETLYVVVINDQPIAFFKDDIDEADTDEKLMSLIASRLPGTLQS